MTISTGDLPAGLQAGRTPGGARQLSEDTIFNPKKRALREKADTKRKFGEHNGRQEGLAFAFHKPCEG